MSTPSPDLLIIGGGAVGLSTAFCALQKGLSVKILDKERAGSRASWSGAGMLNLHPFPNPTPEKPDYHDLIAKGIELHKAWNAQLLEETEINTGFLRCGALDLVTSERIIEEGADKFERMLRACRERNIPATVLTPLEARELEPEINPDTFEYAIHLPQDGQVRSPRFCRALALACRQRGASIEEGVEVKELWIENGHASGALTISGERISAGKTLVCAGAWASQFQPLLDQIPRVAKITPVKGQITCYDVPKRLCSRILTAGHHYIVPRPDGVLLVGSTSERVGFDTVVTDEGQHTLKNFAEALLPALKQQRPVQGWADVRPGLIGSHPILGAVPGIENLFIAAGHYRNGICLAPVSGEIMACYVAGVTGPMKAERWAPKGNVEEGVESGC